MGLGNRAYYYKLEGMVPVPCSWYEAGALMADYNGRCVDHTVLGSGHRISTAFLVFDHNLMGPGDPILWNTIVTDCNGNERIYGKYRSFIQAKIGHRAAVAVIGLLEKFGEKDGSEGGN